MHWREGGGGLRSGYINMRTSLNYVETLLEWWTTLVASAPAPPGTTRCHVGGMGRRSIEARVCLDPFAWRWSGGSTPFFLSPLLIIYLFFPYLMHTLVSSSNYVCVCVSTLVFTSSRQIERHLRAPPPPNRNPKVPGCNKPTKNIKQYICFRSMNELWVDNNNLLTPSMKKLTPIVDDKMRIFMHRIRV